MRRTTAIASHAIDGAVLRDLPLPASHAMIVELREARFLGLRCVPN
jgi:hypothetical protein